MTKEPLDQETKELIRFFRGGYWLGFIACLFALEAGYLTYLMMGAI